MNDWRDHAACREREAGLWSDDDLHSPASQLAAVICAQCPVATFCLDEAIHRGDHWTIRAGRVYSQGQWIPVSEAPARIAERRPYTANRGQRTPPASLGERWCGGCRTHQPDGRFSGQSRHCRDCARACKKARRARLRKEHVA